MRKFQKEKNYYKNNRGSFWELENRIMGRKKRIMCGCLVAGPNEIQNGGQIKNDYKLLALQASV